MKSEMLTSVEKRRVIRGDFASTADDGFNGVFFIKHQGQRLTVIVSDGLGWEHVSVSHPKRCPTWAEMSFIKQLFWDGDEVVIEYHPADDQYVNCHPFCLHLWKPIGVTLPIPPKEMVGLKG